MVTYKMIALMMGTSLFASGMTAIYFRSLDKPAKASAMLDTGQASAVSPQAEVERTIVVQQSVPADVKSNSRNEQPIAQAQSAKLDTAALDIERAERVAEAFETDKTGDSNSQRNENRFRSALTSPKLEGVQLERMECRARACRAALTFDNQAADERAVMRLIKETEDNGYTIIIPSRKTQGDGTTKATAFLFAPGAMPQVDPPADLAQVAASP